MSDYQDCVRADLKGRATRCIHFRPIEMYGRKEGCGCAQGVQIRTEAIDANAGTAFGIALRLPCDAVPDPLFTCPLYKAVGIDRAAEEMIIQREAGERAVKRLARELHMKAPATTQEHGTTPRHNMAQHPDEDES